MNVDSSDDEDSFNMDNLGHDNNNNDDGNDFDQNGHDDIANEEDEEQEEARDDRRRGLNQIINNNEQQEGERNQQRPRVINSPIDINLNNHVVFSSARFQEITLTDLERTDAIRFRLNFKFIDLQLLRIITSSHQNGANIYSNRRGSTGARNIASNQTRFSRLFLFRSYSSNNPQISSKLVYMMEARNENVNLWNKNTAHRDNGTISIGCFIRVVSPLPIKSWMRGDIPILRSQFPCIALNFPARLDTIAINDEITSNESYAFVWNNALVHVDYTAPMKTSCTGELCDRQRVNDWLNVKGCGCYGMLPNSSSLVMQHAIRISTFLNDDLTLDDFSSMRFMELYMRGKLPGTCKLYMLQMTNAGIGMYESIENCIQLINNNGGFTVTGWYKRGSINDKGLIAPPSTNSNGTTNNSGSSNSNYNNNNAEVVQVDASDISYHVISIIPTNRDFLDNTKDLAIQLNALKFDAANIVRVE